MARYPSDIISLLRGAYISRNDIQAFLRAQTEEFVGPTIDPKWRYSFSGGGSVALASDSPTRVGTSTAGVINNLSEVNEGAHYHWSSGDRLTVYVRYRIGNIGPSSASDVQCYPILLDRGANDRIRFGFNHAAGGVIDGGWGVSCLSGGNQTYALAGSEIDTNWHDFDLSISSGSVRARVDCGDIQTITANITACGLELRSGLLAVAAASRVCEIDYILLVPGMAAF